jgi:hypothetical protein
MEIPLKAATLGHVFRCSAMPAIRIAPKGNLLELKQMPTAAGIPDPRAFA